MPELLLKGFQESFRGEVRPATIRVMHDGDVVYVEKVARDADRSLCAAGCAAAGNDDRKDRGVRTDFLFSVFADEFEDLSRVDLAGERLGDGRRNASGHTRVEAMNDDRL